MIGKSALAYVPVNLANILTSFGTIVVLTRLFTGAEFGLYALAMITLQFVHMGFLTWTEASMARFQARAEKNDDVNSHLRTIFTAAFITSAIGFCVIMAVLFLLPLSQMVKTVLMFAVGSTCLQVFFNLGMEAHKASHRIRRYSTIYTSQSLLSFSLGIFLILATPLRVEAPFIGIVVATFLCLLIDLPYMLKQMKGGRYQPEKLKTYFKYGAPICFSLLLTYTLNSADMYLIAGFMGTESAGQYNAGYNLANRSLEIVFVWLAMAVTPIAVTAMEKTGIEESRNVLKNYGAALLWITLPAATGIALVAPYAGFILGESVREEAVKIMPLIAFAGVFNGLITYYAQRAFMLSGRTGMFVWCMIVPVIINIALNFVWIPKFGLMGAVYATLLSYILGFLISVWVGRKYYPLPLPVKASLQIILSCAVMAAFVHMTPVPDAWPDVIKLLIKAFIGGMLYLAISFMTNAADCRGLMFDIAGKIKPTRSVKSDKVAVK